MKEEATKGLETLIELQNLDLEILLESETRDKPIRKMLGSVGEEISAIFNRLFLLRKKRKSVAESLGVKFLEHYETLKKKKGVILAVVPVEEGNCQGCSRPVPKPTLFMMRKKGHIGSCFHCGRFLYLAEDSVK